MVPWTTSHPPQACYSGISSLGFAFSVKYRVVEVQACGLGRCSGRGTKASRGRIPGWGPALCPSSTTPRIPAVLAAVSLSGAAVPSLVPQDCPPFLSPSSPGLPSILRGPSSASFPSRLRPARDADCCSSGSEADPTAQPVNWQEGAPGWGSWDRIAGRWGRRNGCEIYCFQPGLCGLCSRFRIWIA